MSDDFKSYSNDVIEVLYSRTRCTHAAECVKRLRPVFNVRQRPWINVDNGSVEDIIDAVNLCPSGALKYNLKKPVETEPNDND